MKYKYIIKKYFIYGIIANPVSGNPIKAFQVASLISQAKPSSNPPPKANPSMAAMVGKGNQYTLSKVVLRPYTKSSTSSFVYYNLAYYIIYSKVYI